MRFKLISLIYVPYCIKLYQRQSGLCQDKAWHKMLHKGAKGAEKPMKYGNNNYRWSNDRLGL